jgi:hypothetical protein
VINNNLINDAGCWIKDKEKLFTLLNNPELYQD